jgi:2-oxoglutarate ferredoxin oxidoreductase subunit beta
LTKGQYSPTSEMGKITKSTPYGSLDFPFNPLSLAIGAEASFVARTVDSDRKHLTEVLRQASAHRGSAFVEIYQNCPIFNDGAFESLKDPESRESVLVRLQAGEPIRFGANGEKGVRVGASGGLEVVDAVGNEDSLLVHDPARSDPSMAFQLSRLAADSGATPVGVFRNVPRDAYDDLLRDQVEGEIAKRGRGELASLLTSGDTWTINS